jgi:hypothetical protein
MAGERRRFLVHCAEQRLTPTSLRIIAAYTRNRSDENSHLEHL